MTNKTWKRRKKGAAVEGWPDVVRSDVIGRVYTVHPSQHECFFLRLLLHTVRGPTSFQDLRTFENQLCATYREACAKRGLLEDDAIWERTMEEAASIRSPKQLRQLFAILLKTCSISDPFDLWEKFRENMAEDFLHRVQQERQSEDITFSDPIFNEALLDLENNIRSMGGDSISIYGLPEPVQSTGDLTSEYLRELNYSVEDLSSYISEHESQLISEQRSAYEAILHNVRAERGGLFFLDAPGGTGKTFVINLLLAKVRQAKGIALAVASSGIAATLLEGGRTAHSAFKLPLNLDRNETPVCNISRGSTKAKLLRECKLIIWDEATMSHKNALEALDRTLQDLRRNNEVLGGVTALLSGDFRQILPVIPRGTRADEVKACLKSSPLWNKVNITCNYVICY